jgi:type IV secretion system protein VirB9
VSLIKFNFIKKYSTFLFFMVLMLSFAKNLFAQTPITTDSRIRTLVYNANEVYELKFYYNYQSFIEFSDDEEIEMISIGEAFAWRLTPAGKRIFIRPLEIAAHTNMTIITNRRTYHFDIRSDEFDGKADEELVYTVRFFYPQIGQPLPIPPQLAVPNVAIVREPKAPGIIKTSFPAADVGKPLSPVIERNINNNELNFDYSLAGKSDDIIPLKVYDDSTETFFQFANNNASIPTISLVDVNGNETPLQYLIKDNYISVPAIGRQFTLRKNNSLLCIYNNNLLQAQK